MIVWANLVTTEEHVRTALPRIPARVLMALLDVIVKQVWLLFLSHITLDNCFSTNYFLVLCHLDINDCQPNPCMNNGICVDGINSFSCNCAHGFIGKHCTISKFTVFLEFTLIYQYLRKFTIKEHLDINRYWRLYGKSLQ